MTQEPIARDGMVTVGWCMWANLALDHRAADGAIAARFLAKLQEKVNYIYGELQESR
jgi:pyruvate/2-oxoglutarate dehydrogenase complex dihydrolipoamide acyltransferase (E2) component